MIDETSPVTLSVQRVIPVKNVAPGRGPVALEVGVLAYGETAYAPDTPYTAELLELGHLLRMPEPKPEKRGRRTDSDDNPNPPAGEEE